MPSGAGAHPRHRRSGRHQDLTHVFSAGFPVYTGAAPARRTLSTVEANGFYSQEWTFGEHSGTHMDAPGHFVADGRRVPALDPAELFAPAAVVDISRRARLDPDAVVEVRDLRRLERRHGRIPHGAVVFMYSGWEERLPDSDAFKNAGADGTYHFPGFGLDAVEWLLERRGITGIGVDTLSLDPGNSATFDVTGDCSGPIGTASRTWPTSIGSRRSAPDWSWAWSRGRKARAALAACWRPTEGVVALDGLRRDSELLADLLVQRERLAP